jgi:uncharacterized membrane protein YcaP (DUF421 family)
VFHMSMGVFEHIGRGVVVYVFLFVLLRFVGKKHVGQLAPFDLLVLLILSETVQNSLIGDDTSLVGGLISAATLVGLSYGMSMLTSSSKLAERLLEGTPKILAPPGRRDEAATHYPGRTYRGTAPSRLCEYHSGPSSDLGK